MADVTINDTAKYILKNNAIGMTRQNVPINQYVLYNESLKVVQLLEMTVTQVKAAIEGKDIKSVSAAWLRDQGAFYGNF